MLAGQTYVWRGLRCAGRSSRHLTTGRPGIRRSVSPRPAVTTTAPVWHPHSARRSWAHHLLIERGHTALW